MECFFDRNLKLWDTRIIYFYKTRMIEQAIKNYYIFFDEKIESSTFIVLFISMIIFFVWAFVPHANAQGNLYKSSSLESRNISNTFKNIVLIDGVEYELNFSKVTN